MVKLSREMPPPPPPLMIDELTVRLKEFLNSPLLFKNCTMYQSNSL